MNPASHSKVRRSPWGWIPSLYIAEGLPYFAVNSLTVLMYTNMGIPKDQMALYTGFLYLPWVIKPFWSPFVDIIRTKRWWILSMQLLICITIGLVAFFATTSSFFIATLIVFWLMAFFSATHDIAADGYYMLELDDKAQAAFVGVRSTFYRLASILGQGGLVILAGVLEKNLDNIPLAWSVTFGFLSILFFLIFIWDVVVLPYPSKDRPNPTRNSKTIINEFGKTFITFFTKKNVWIALAFILLYRLPEALCIKLIGPFFLDPQAQGGLGMTTTEVGIANGTVGVIALLAGGILGGVLIARYDLRRMIWPMALALTLPCAIYLLFALYQPTSIILISIGVGFEQFGYGVGFTAFMLYMMYFSQGESQTSHYAFCTAFMALGLMLPGMVAGYIFNECCDFDLFGIGNKAGYIIFFTFVMLTSLITFLTVAIVRPTLKDTDKEE